jgi:hypothetical protein
MVEHRTGGDQPGSKCARRSCSTSTAELRTSRKKRFRRKKNRACMDRRDAPSTRTPATPGAAYNHRLRRSTLRFIVDGGSDGLATRGRQSTRKIDDRKNRVLYFRRLKFRVVSYARRKRWTRGDEDRHRGSRFVRGAPSVSGVRPAASGCRRRTGTRRTVARAVRGMGPGPRVHRVGQQRRVQEG